MRLQQPQCQLLLPPTADAVATTNTEPASVTTHCRCCSYNSHSASFCYHPLQMLWLQQPQSQLLLPPTAHAAATTATEPASVTTHCTCCGYNGHSVGFCYHPLQMPRPQQPQCQLLLSSTADAAATTATVPASVITHCTCCGYNSHSASFRYHPLHMMRLQHPQCQLPLPPTADDAATTATVPASVNTHCNSRSATFCYHPLQMLRLQQPQCQLLLPPTADAAATTATVPASVTTHCR